MIYGLWNAAAGMAANQYRQNIAANNIANIDTIGFKHDVALLRERPVESKENSRYSSFSHELFDRLSGGTQVKPTLNSFEQGPVQLTNRPLDAMIQGKGLFTVQTADGIRYTRNGNFAVNSKGELVTAGEGHPVLDEAGAPITVGPGAEPEIDEQGRVRQGSAVVAKMGVVEFNDIQQLRKTGGNLYTTATNSVLPKPSASQIVPRALEGSTVNPITGMTDMIESSRAFQMNANVLTAMDGTLERLLSGLANFR